MKTIFGQLTAKPFAILKLPNELHSFFSAGISGVKWETVRDPLFKSVKNEPDEKSSGGKTFLGHQINDRANDVNDFIGFCTHIQRVNWPEKI